MPTYTKTTEFYGSLTDINGERWWNYEGTNALGPVWGTNDVHDISPVESLPQQSRVGSLDAGLKEIDCCTGPSGCWRITVEFTPDGL